MISYAAMKLINFSALLERVSFKRIFSVKMSEAYASSPVVL